MKIAVLVPCYNEEAAIAKVVADFRAALPGAAIYVYDNNSRDQTMARAQEAGYSALILTVDVPVAGARLRDLRNGLTIPPALRQ